jgi:SAM-dependent methyltransferase
MEDVWDRLASLHYRQLDEGRDITFHKVFWPKIIGTIQSESKFNTYSVFDAGCGAGYLTNLISQYAYEIVGVDSSIKSIEIARQHNQKSDHMYFEHTTINQYCERHLQCFDYVISHLVLHLIEDLDSTLQSLNDCLKKNGVFLFSIPHPCFWAMTGGIGTWNFVNKGNYKYHIASTQENCIQIDGEDFITFYYHRPIETYISNISKNGFIVEEAFAPMPDGFLMLKNNKKPWPYPRFLFLRCRKN